MLFVKYIPMMKEVARMPSSLPKTRDHQTQLDWHPHHRHIREPLSWQATALNLTLRSTLKPVLARVNVSHRTIWMAQRLYSLASPLLARLPESVDLQAVDFEHFTGEWIRAGQHLDENKVLLYLHGGGYFFSSAALHRPITWRLSLACKRPVLAINYRMAPAYQFRHWLDDAVTAYTHLLERGYQPHNILVAGDSAGGNLVLIMLQSLRHQGLPLPAACICLSPWTDITGGSASMHHNRHQDPMFAARAVSGVGRYVSQGVDPEHPWVSPAKADLSGFPPLMIMVGSTEVLRDDALRVAERAHAYGVPVVYEEWVAMPHVFPIFAAFMPEARKAYQHIARFVRDVDRHRGDYE